MSVKCIAIGNRIRGDDAIGVKVLEELETKLVKKNIELIFGETDNEHALSKIEDEDLLFIIDSTYFDTEPGTVSFTPINNIPMQQNFTFQHEPSLIHLIKLCKKNVSGFVIGIEVEKIDFSINLSNTLNLKLDEICEQVYGLIIDKIKN